jgi:hypothetical protein
MEEEFFATIKLRSGEELFTKVAATEEENGLYLVLSDPIVITQSTSIGLVVEPWLKTTSQSMFIIDIHDVLTMSESNDIEMIKMYTSFVRKREKIKNGNHIQLTKEMGYVGNVNDIKYLLEKLYTLDKTELSE